jgi:hypothetical protein
LKSTGADLDRIRIFSLPILVIAISIIAFFTIMGGLLQNKIKSDAHLEEALFDELTTYFE